MELWEELTDLMLERNIGPDFIAIDGGEGGTGAAPPSLLTMWPFLLYLVLQQFIRFFRKRTR